MVKQQRSLQRGQAVEAVEARKRRWQARDLEVVDQRRRHAFAQPTAQDGKLRR
jgi:hypothetical protein